MRQGNILMLACVDNLSNWYRIPSVPPRSTSQLGLNWRERNETTRWLTRQRGKIRIVSQTCQIFDNFFHENYVLRTSVEYTLTLYTMCYNVEQCRYYRVQTIPAYDWWVWTGANWLWLLRLLIMTEGRSDWAQVWTTNLIKTTQNMLLLLIILTTDSLPRYHFIYFLHKGRYLNIRVV